jgi:DUF1009 family protein
MTAAPVGLIAGAGRFPVLFAEKARQLGIPVVCIGIADMADPSLKTICTEFRWLKRLSLGFALRLFRRTGVRQWTMAGKYHKHILFQPWKWLRFLPDWKAARLWFSHRRRDNKDDSLLLSLIDAFKTEGFHCVSALEICPELLVVSGNLTQRKPTEKELADIRFGWALAKEMGRLDIGQSVMIREKACIAVEAIEGTDKCIERAGELCKKNGFTVVKVAKPQQDMRFDVPTIGPKTIESMRAAGAATLAIEAGKTIILDEPETIALANRYRIAIIAYSTDEITAL